MHWWIGTALLLTACAGSHVPEEQQELLEAWETFVASVEATEDARWACREEERCYDAMLDPAITDCVMRRIAEDDEERELTLEYLRAGALEQDECLAISGPLRSCGACELDHRNPDSFPLRTALFNCTVELDLFPDPDDCRRRM